MKEQKMTLQEYTDITDFTNIKLTPLQAIKFKCKECYVWNWREAKKCTDKTCPLNQFITNKREYNISDEERERRRNIFKN